MKNKDIDAAWAAGIIDGEGSITIVKRSPSYTLQLEIVNTDLAMLQKMKNLYGGTVYTRKKQPKLKQAYTWKLQQEKAGSVLLSVYSHLITKNEQSLVGLQFLVDFLSSKGGSLTSEIIEKRDSYYTQLRKLKR